VIRCEYCRSIRWKHSCVRGRAVRLSGGHRRVILRESDDHGGPRGTPHDRLGALPIPRESAPCPAWTVAACEHPEVMPIPGESPGTTSSVTALRQRCVIPEESVIREGHGGRMPPHHSDRGSRGIRPPCPAPPGAPVAHPGPTDSLGITRTDSAVIADPEPCTIPEESPRVSVAGSGVAAFAGGNRPGRPSPRRSPRPTPDPSSVASDAS
jgi:hypothetical protein